MNKPEKMDKYAELAWGIWGDTPYGLARALRTENTV